MTGFTTVVGPTTQALTAVTEVNGTFYAFDVGTQQLLTLDLANGQTSLVTDVNPVLGYIEGATPTPEPFSIELAGIGIIGLILCRLRKRSRDLKPAELPIQ